MKQQEFSNKIEAFLANELSPAEMKAFEVELDRVPTLAEEVELCRMEQLAMDELMRQDIAAQIPHWRKEMDHLPPSPSMSRATARWATSVGVIALVVLAAWLVWKKVADDGKQRTPKIIESVTPVATVAPQAPSPSAATDPQHAATGKKNGQNHSTHLDKPAADQQEALPAPVNTYPFAQLAEANIGDMHELSYATKGARTSDQKYQRLWEETQTAFKKTDHDLAGIKNNLGQIPPEAKQYYPFAQEMLATLYLQEKDYPNALLHYRKYAVFAKLDIAAQWRLLNIQLAVLPEQEILFWEQMKLVENSPSKYQAMAKELRQQLREKAGFVESKVANSIQEE